MSTAFEAAQAGGVIDLFLGLPDSKDKQSKKFDKIRAIANDAETKEMAMPAQYMFKGVPTYDQVDDPVALALGEMDKHTRGADKVMYAGYYAAGLTLDRIFSEMPAVPFRDHVWPKFLRENAQRVFGLSS